MDSLANDFVGSIFFLFVAFVFGCLFILGASFVVSFLILWDKYQEKHWRWQPALKFNHGQELASRRQDDRPAQHVLRGRVAAPQVSQRPGAAAGSDQRDP